MTGPAYCARSTCLHWEHFHRLVRLEGPEWPRKGIFIGFARELGSCYWDGCDCPAYVPPDPEGEA